jgi:hypothetical protein
MNPMSVILDSAPLILWIGVLAALVLVSTFVVMRAGRLLAGLRKSTRDGFSRPGEDFDD